MRLRLDGSIPDDNPFLSRDNALPEIWSYGHRNPQGLLYDNNTGNLWSIEHGPRGGDEINLVVKGANYGWPVISYGKEYWGPVSIGEGTEKPGMEQPVKVYIPSIAPGSLLLYSATAFPQWQGNLFSGALKLRHLNRVSISVDNKAIAEERLLGDLNERIRALAQSPEGWIYFSTDSGKIIRMRPRE
jgi:glucose/arabinose dehydrogenase